MLAEDTEEKDSKLNSPSETAIRLEDRRREDIRGRLKDMYGSAVTEKYQHFGPPYSAERASLNDVGAIRSPPPGFGELKKLSMAVQAETVARRVWDNAAA